MTNDIKINDFQALCSTSVGSLGIFEHMFDKGYCVKLADFYIRWADDLERAEDYQKTIEVFKQGQKLGAQPADKLNSAKR